MCRDIDRRQDHDSVPRTPLEQRAADEMASQTGASPPTVTATAPFVCRDWCNRCWARWVRIRSLEHLRGEHFWQELDRGDFGLLRQKFHPNASLIQEIERLLSTGDENLVVINRIVEQRWPLRDVVAILSKIDLNERRLPRFPFLPAQPRRC